ncbi:CYFA0S13e02806g1_1 [Cyberlindnera fabianii]|uniref:Quinate transporter n=1 Tax=Cyberlindnera fabianii TaxID=36022 RepID=A0A061B2Q4_CYBFA|nr:CYFA0S13e02806g1_1 [Cyberlindnera fabianii]
MFQRHETRPTPPQIYNARIYWSAIVASWVAVIIGYDAGFIGGAVALSSFKTEFGFNDMSASKQSTTSEQIISLFHVGAFFGALFTYPLAHYTGRKMSLLVATLLLIVGSAIQLASSTSIGLGPMYAGRVLTGVGIGAVSNVAPMYAAEIAPPSIRGQLIGFYEIAWQVGGVFGFWINYGTSVNIADTEAKQWQIPVAIQLVPPGILAMTLWSLPESPRWLLGVGRREKAIKNLCYLRKLDPDHEYIAYEMNIFEQEIIEKSETVGTGLFDPFKTIITSKALTKRLALSSASFIIQNTVAVNAVNYYSPKIFQTMGIDSVESSLLSTGVFGIIKGVCCLIWSMCIVDRYGRRTSCIFGLVMCSLCFWYIGAYIKISDPAARIASGDAQIDAGGKAALALFYIWTICYAFSWSGTPWVWNSEAFSTTIRSATSSVNAASNWFWAFIMARFTAQMITTMKYGIFFFFGACMTVALPLYMYFYPETKNVPPEYIDELFNHPAWKAHGIVMEKIAMDQSRANSVNLPLQDSDTNGKESFALDELLVDDKKKPSQSV